MNQRDYYNILGLAGDVDQKSIKEAYRKLAFQYHPDMNKDPAATEKMKDINEAYAVLSDVAKRKEYDFLRSQYGASASDQFRQGHTTDDIFRGSDIDQIFEEFAKSFGFRSSGDIFRESYGSEYKSFEFRSAGMSGRGFIFNPGVRSNVGEESAQNRQAQIPGGSLPGFAGGVLRFLLKAIGIQLPERGKDRHDKISLSPEKARDGAEVEYSFRKGDGRKALMVKIPREIRDGQRIRLKRMGAPGKYGGEPGDLYLQVRLKKSLAQRLNSLLKT
ncbi:MAG: DnaJ domain-containing protein [Dehalococcoidales bacterium]|nr:DnaJ domain-containing protein [Dehalococcoidales bacterium]